jgi:hypothetical protein
MAAARRALRVEARPSNGNDHQALALGADHVDAEGEHRREGRRHAPPVQRARVVRAHHEEAADQGQPHRTPETRRESPAVEERQPDEQAQRGEVLDGHSGADLETVDRHEERRVDRRGAQHAEHRQARQLLGVHPQQVAAREAEDQQEDQERARRAQLRQARGVDPVVEEIARHAPVQ